MGAPRRCSHAVDPGDLAAAVELREEMADCWSVPISFQRLMPRRFQAPPQFERAGSFSSPLGRNRTGCNRPQGGHVQACLLIESEEEDCSVRWRLYR